MSLVNNGFKSAVLWHMNGCVVTFYEAENEDQKKKKPISTISFSNFSSIANLAYKNMTSLRIASPAIPYLENLSALKLQNNNLSSLPIELWRLRNLRELNLGYNSLEVLPKQIGLLVNLRELYLHNNCLARLPAQIKNLQHLTVLDITANKLSTIPFEILSLELDSFWFDKNDFNDAIPTTARTLQFLSLKDTCIQTIGLLCMEDEESRKVIADCNNQIHLDFSSILYDSPQLLPYCTFCNSPMFQPGLDLVDIEYCRKSKLAVSFTVCSQTCYIKQFNYRQNVSINEIESYS